MSNDWLRLVRDPKPWEPPALLPGPIVTERTIVRLYRKGDGPGLFDAVSTERKSLMPWMVWARTDHLDESDSIYYVENQRRGYADAGCNNFAMGILDRATEQLIGGTGLHDIDRGLKTAEIGYWVRGSRAGTGICTEAVRGLITRALAPQEDRGWGLRRLVIYNAVENVASRRVCEKLGLRLESRMKQSRYVGPVDEDGARGYHDMLGFAVLADEWDGESGPG